MLLEADYYVNHFWKVVESLETTHIHLLEKAEHEFLQELRQISGDALRLFARLMNRKLQYYRLAKLSYPEIENLDSACSELIKRGFIVEINTGNCEAAKLLGCFTVNELKTRFLCLPKNLQRSAIVEFISQDKNLYSELLADNQIIYPSKYEIWAFCRFLFFGELQPNLSAFVVRDLGTITTEKVDVISSKYATRQQALEHFNLLMAYEEFRSIRDELPAMEVYTWLKNKNFDASCLTYPAVNIFNKLCNRVGVLLERANYLEQAKELYCQAAVAPNRERLVRLHNKTKNVDKALELCTEILDRPQSAEEFYNVTQLFNRLNKTAKRSQARELLTGCKSVTLDYSEVNVELAILNHYAGQGWNGVHSENWIWNSVFGLCFWDVIYDRQGFHNQLQYAPVDLYESFYANRHEKINAHLASLKNSCCKSLALETYEKKRGLANPFVFWHKDGSEVIETLLSLIPNEAVIAIMHLMVQDLRNNTKGFPDLFLWKNSEYQLIEVKSENDHISPQQYFWSQMFMKHGLNHQILRVYQLEEPTLELASL